MLVKSRFQDLSEDLKAFKHNIGVVNISFTILNYLCSGTSIKEFRVHSQHPSDDTSRRWIRYVTKSIEFMHHLTQ